MMPYLPLAVVALVIALALALPLLREDVLPLPRRRMLAVLLVVIVLAGGAGLYTLLGAGEGVEAIGKQRAEQAALRTKLGELLQRSEAQPQDAENWRALGQAWVEARDFPQAVEALRQAVLASGGHPDIIAEYAAALVMQNNGTVGEDAVNSIGMALKLNPEQPLARELEALWHQQQSKGVGSRE